MDLLSLGHQGAQFQEQPFPRHLQDIETRLARGGPEKVAGLSAELKDVEIVVNDDTGRRIVRQDDALRLILHVKAATMLRRGRLILFLRLAVTGKDKRREIAIRSRFFDEDAVRLVHRSEQVGECSDGFRVPQEEVTIRLERVMEQGKHPVLERRSEIDQQVPTTDEIQPRKGGIFADVLLRKHADVPNAFADLIPRIRLQEEPPEALGRHVQRDVFHVQSRPGLFQVRLVDVGAEDLNLTDAVLFAEKLQERNREGVDFLTG